MLNRRTSLLALVLPVLTNSILISNTYATIFATIQENGSDVTMTATGSVDLSGLLSDFGGPGFSGFWLGQNNAYGSFQGPWDNYKGGTLIASPGWPGTGFLSAAGDSLGMQLLPNNTQNLIVPSGYVSGQSISTVFSSVTLANQSFTSLGLSPGLTATYQWTSNSGPESLIINTIPEPSTVFSTGLLSAMAAIGFRFRHRLN